MSATIETREPFVEHACVHVVLVRPTRVVVEQQALPQLDNHVGVRHASALHAAAYEASRLLVAAALAEHDPLGSIRLGASEISYTALGLGLLTTTAKPSGPGWETLSVELAAGANVTLDCTARTTNAEGRSVLELNASWVLEPNASSARC